VKSVASARVRVRAGPDAGAFRPIGQLLCGGLTGGAGGLRTAYRFFAPGALRIPWVGRRARPG
jgi:hypothetical protein